MDGEKINFFSFNDVDEHIVNCKILKYADDIRIYRCFEPNSSAQQANAALFKNDMNALATWSKNWDQLAGGERP